MDTSIYANDMYHPNSNQCVHIYQLKSPVIVTNPIEITWNNQLQPKNGHNCRLFGSRGRHFERSLEESWDYGDGDIFVAFLFAVQLYIYIYFSGNGDEQELNNMSIYIYIYIYIPYIYIYIYLDPLKLA